MSAVIIPFARPVAFQPAEMSVPPYERRTEHCFIQFRCRGKRVQWRHDNMVELGATLPLVSEWTLSALARTIDDLTAAFGDFKPDEPAVPHVELRAYGRDISVWLSVVRAGWRAIVNVGDEDKIPADVRAALLALPDVSTRRWRKDGR